MLGCAAVTKVPVRLVAVILPLTVTFLSTVIALLPIVAMLDPSTAMTILPALMPSSTMLILLSSEVIIELSKELSCDVRYPSVTTSALSTGSSACNLPTTLPIMALNTPPSFLSCMPPRLIVLPLRYKSLQRRPSLPKS